jgi:hypothetical protein
MLKAAQIVDERGQAKLGSDIFEAAHEERALIHPFLDAAERMLNDLAATVENLTPRFEAFGHADPSRSRRARNGDRSPQE